MKSRRSDSDAAEAASFSHRLAVREGIHLRLDEPDEYTGWLVSRRALSGTEGRVQSFECKLTGCLFTVRAPRRAGLKSGRPLSRLQVPQAGRLFAARRPIWIIGR